MISVILGAPANSSANKNGESTSSSFDKTSSVADADVADVADAADEEDNDMIPKENVQQNGDEMDDGGDKNDNDDDGGNDGGTDDDGDDDVVPLVVRQRLHRRYRRTVGSSGRVSYFGGDDEEYELRQPLEISNAYSCDYHDDQASSCWGDTWRSVASCLLLSVLLTPMLYSYVRRHYPQHQSYTTSGGIIRGENDSSGSGRFNETAAAELLVGLGKALKYADERLEKDPDSCMVAPFNFSSLLDDFMGLRENAKEKERKDSGIYCDPTALEERKEKIRQKLNVSRGSEEDLDLTLRNACSCHDPFHPVVHVPEVPQLWEAWDSTHDHNVALANNATLTKNLDVVLLGDSITEHWLGTDLGSREQRFQGIFEQYQRYFGGDGTGRGELRGLALGIAGDRCQQLLWRLQEGGEMPHTLQPKVWWILIGSNDLGADGCSCEGVLLGILNVVVWVRQQRPDAHIVIQAILPRASDATGLLVKTDATPSEKSDAMTTIWDRIQWINTRLNCFVENSIENRDEENKLLHYYDATELFITEGGTRIDPEVMPDKLHPNGKGAHIWGEAIVQYVKKILKKSSS